VRISAEGITAGIIGGATVAFWFLVLDSLHRHPLYTPTLLGTAIFRPATPIAPPEALPVSAPMVILFTALHGVIFVGFGEIAALLVRLAEKNANYAFGVVLFLVIFLSGFLFVTTVFGADVLDVLSLAGRLRRQPPRRRRHGPLLQASAPECEDAAVTTR